MTECDRETEAVLRDLIRASYPDHGILGEELGADRHDAASIGQRLRKLHRHELGRLDLHA